MRRSNGRNVSDPAWMSTLCRVYAAALWLYPRGHRLRWGADMQQAFRDRCREAARAGRGPWQIGFAELLPDLAVSVGRERIESVTELSPMKRVLLAVLLFALAGSVIFRTQLGDTVLATQEWWKQRQAFLDQRALEGQEAALAALVEQRGGAHAELVAAQLYWAAGEGFRRRYAEPTVTPLTAGEIVASDALLDRADAALTRALRANDAWALWVAAAMSCPARTVVCRADASFSRLRKVDAENGAVWLSELLRAGDAGDVARQRAALARLARVSRFDWHFGDGLRGMLAAFTLRPLPQRLLQSYQDGQTATPEDSATLLGGMIGAENMAISGPGWQPLLNFCRTRDASIDAERAADCHAAGRLLAERGTGMTDVLIGYRLWLRTSDSFERAQVQQRMRDARWRMQQYVNVMPTNSPEAARRWRAAWMSSTSEMQVYDRLLRQRGIPLQAPSDFKLDPDYTDPAH